MVDWLAFRENPQLPPADQDHNQTDIQHHQFLWASRPYDQIDAIKPYRKRIDQLIDQGLRPNTEIRNAIGNGSLAIQLFINMHHEYAVRYLFELYWYEQLTLANKLRCIMSALFTRSHLGAFPDIVERMLSGVSPADIHNLVLSDAWRSRIVIFADSQNKFYTQCEDLYDFLNSKDLLPPMEQRPPPAPDADVQEEDDGIEQPHRRLPMPRWWD